MRTIILILFVPLIMPMYLVCLLLEITPLLFDKHPLWGLNIVYMEFIEHIYGDLDKDFNTFLESISITPARRIPYKEPDYGDMFIIEDAAWVGRK